MIKSLLLSSLYFFIQKFHLLYRIGHWKHPGKVQRWVIVSVQTYNNLNWRSVSFQVLNQFSKEFFLPQNKRKFLLCSTIKLRPVYSYLILFTLVTPYIFRRHFNSVTSVCLFPALSHLRWALHTLARATLLIKVHILAYKNNQCANIFIFSPSFCFHVHSNTPNFRETTTRKFEDPHNSSKIIEKSCY